MLSNLISFYLSANYPLEDNLFEQNSPQINPSIVLEETEDKEVGIDRVEIDQTYIKKNNLPPQKENKIFLANQKIQTIFKDELLTSSTPAPQKNLKYLSPLLKASSIASFDLDSNSYLYKKNISEKRPIASITKLMTVLIILEENELDELSTVSINAASTEGSTMKLYAGEEITVENLLYGTLINSANDGAVALAEHNAGSVDDFVLKMNLKAKSLGMKNTKFTNPTGLDYKNAYSTVEDIIILAKNIYKYPIVQKIVAQKEIQVNSSKGNHKHLLTNTNELLSSYLKVKGLKTGRTDEAGLCLVTIAENNNNNEIITVILNSPDRFQESKALIDWSFRAYSWKTNSEETIKISPQSNNSEVILQNPIKESKNI